MLNSFAVMQPAACMQWVNDVWRD